MEVTTRTIGEHELTDEMNTIIDAVQSGQSIKGFAYAGAGKSTLLRAIEKYHTNNIGLYICYNKSLEREARTLFKGHSVHIATSHSFALSSFDKDVKFKFLTKVKLKHSRETIIKYAQFDTNNVNFKLLNINKHWRIVLSIVNQFISSASTKLTQLHLTDKVHHIVDQLVKHDTIKVSQKEELLNYLAHHAELLSGAMFDFTNNCPCSHDTYVKVWQLTNPKIIYDYIMFDEAQDANPVLLSVILKQSCQQIFVGDKFQSIYQFRGGVNAMDIIPHPAYPLSHSFRFGPNIANLATKVLNHSDANVLIHGKGFDTQIIKGSEYNGSEPFLYLSHTNVNLLNVLISCYQAKIPAVFTSNKAGMTLSKLKSMVSLHTCGKANLVSHKKYPTLEALLLGEKDLETQTFGEWIEHQDEKVELLVQALKWTLNIPDALAQVHLSTAHLSKGLEFDTVMLADDFKSIIASFHDGRPLNETDLNLFYVAVTRAKKTLVIPDELYAALESNLAFTLNKHEPAKCLLDNLLPVEVKSPGAKNPKALVHSNLPVQKSKTGANVKVKSNTPEKPSSLASSAEPQRKNKPTEREHANVSVNLSENQPQKATNPSETKKTDKSTPCLKESIRKTSGSISVEVGRSKSDDKALTWRPTDTNEYLNPNLAVVGTMGTGKTQTVKSILTQLKQQEQLNTGNESLGVLIFDYKSDYVDDKFISATCATVLEPNNLPINPFALHSQHRLAPMNTAKVFISTLSKVFKLGVKQEQTLKNCIIAAYESKNIDKDNLSSFNNTPPTLRDVFAIYNSQKKIPQDSLTSALSDLYDFEIFEKNGRLCQNLYDTLEGNVVVVSLGGLDPNLQNLIVAVLLDQFYTQMHLAPKPDPQGHERALKKLVLVDEADNFMSQDFISLRKILKEGREFGVGCLLSTQGLDHFQTSENSYSDYMTAWICHRLNNPKSKDVEQLLNTKSKSELDNRLNEMRELKKHHSLFINGKKEVTYQESTAFWKLFDV